MQYYEHNLMPIQSERYQKWTKDITQWLYEFWYHLDELRNLCLCISNKYLARLQNKVSKTELKFLSTSSYNVKNKWGMNRSWYKKRRMNRCKRKKFYRQKDERSEKMTTTESGIDDEMMNGIAELSRESEFRLSQECYSVDFQQFAAHQMTCIHHNFSPGGNMHEQSVAQRCEIGQLNKNNSRNLDLKLQPQQTLAINPLINRDMSQMELLGPFPFSFCPQVPLLKKFNYWQFLLISGLLFYFQISSLEWLSGPNPKRFIYRISSNHFYHILAILYSNFLLDFESLSTITEDGDEKDQNPRSYQQVIQESDVKPRACKCHGNSPGDCHGIGQS
ncbi:hypothetical protein VP01_1512g3 [Puccinia sorghi]|uniref:Uncharacterized protein n=1 Tax=Puccinia sorghi TaxID=27349 RepID=A0A0L6VJG1_9BASI|nr:hypothetical protein VP01_1512g3 [Puccinia sorghi]